MGERRDDRGCSRGARRATGGVAAMLAGLAGLLALGLTAESARAAAPAMGAEAAPGGPATKPAPAGAAPLVIPGPPGSSAPGGAASGAAGITAAPPSAAGIVPTPAQEAGAPGGPGVAPSPGTSADAPSEPERVVPVGDATPAASDHDAVAGAFGVEVRRIDATAPVLARDPMTGCTDGTPPICPPVVMNVLAVRRWVSRTLAWSGGLALSAGGGRDGDRLLDTHFGLGPSFGLAVLLANWRHLAVSASPDVTAVFFRPSGDGGTSYLVDMRTDIEGELHFGMLGVPALSLGIRSGVLLRLEHAGDVSLWTLGVAGTTTLWGLVNQLVLRYYF